MRLPLSRSGPPSLPFLSHSMSIFDAWGASCKSSRNLMSMIRDDALVRDFAPHGGSRIQ